MVRTARWWNPVEIVRASREHALFDDIGVSSEAFLFQIQTPGHLAFLKNGQDMSASKAGEARFQEGCRAPSFPAYEFPD
jgi:hypothetical protein